MWVMVVFLGSETPSGLLIDSTGCQSAGAVFAKGPTCATGRRTGSQASVDCQIHCDTIHC